MACSKEEIERKRIAALQKRQRISGGYNNQNQSIVNSPGSSYASSNTDYGPVKNNVHQKGNFHPYMKPETSSSNVPAQASKVVSGTVYLISEDRFEVNPSEFCMPLINIFKTLPSKSYDTKSKLWNFSMNDYRELMSKVSTLAPYVVLGPLPSYVLKILNEPVVDPETIDLSPIESTLRNKLLPFQEEGVRFGIARRGRCMIADDMGLGKTFQALAIASYYRHNWPLLIVTTSSMRDTWQSKIHELLPSVPMMNVATLTSKLDTQLVADKQTEVVIVSYKITSLHSNILKSKKFGCLIIDESHYLKSHKAQCTVSLAALARGAARVLLLSGTPALSRPAELYTQLDLILPRLFTSYTEYGKRYCAGKQTNFGWDMTGQSNLAELQVILHKRFLIRRTKDQVLTKLERKTRETVILQCAGAAALSRLAASCTAPPTSATPALLSYFSESAVAKIPPVCKYIKQLLKETSEKFLVFAHHKIMIEAICSTLDENNTHYICIVGSTPPSTRAELVETFQHGASCRAAVLSVTAAGAGLTLTAAGLVVFAELHWNPGVLTQAESRAHRLGREGGVCVRYLLAPATADDVMWPLLRDKLEVLNSVGLSEETFEDATVKHQNTSQNIDQYLSPSLKKNASDYIPGTNIRKFQQQEVPKTNTDTSEQSNEELITEKSFLDQDEDDELLANLDL